jgi:tetratricopeptide (TPR) repeat protein
MNYCIAIPDFDKAIELNPDFADAYFNRGCAKGSLEQIADALADFDAAIHLNPDYVDAYCTRALVKSALGCTREAMQDLQTALKFAEQTVVHIKGSIQKLQ